MREPNQPAAPDHNHVGHHATLDLRLVANGQRVTQDLPLNRSVDMNLPLRCHIPGNDQFLTNLRVSASEMLRCCSRLFYPPYNGCVCEAAHA